ncbi:hypothetical protein [Vulcanisaeta thermophila]|uniref:hypothetical protein n=1 Tax=Vulcanisaeta thermophila TaxID=867917 RepID=UPI0011806D1F|nr:hypothetical protein [Vulcanisaeta thermophila]
MGLTKYLIVRSLRNRNTLLWGYAFSIFWITVGAFIFTKNFSSIPPQYLSDVTRLYTADWLTFAIPYMGSVVAVGFLQTLVYQTAAVAYLRRFGMLSPWKYLLSYYTAMTALIIIVSFTVAPLNIVLQYLGFNYNGMHVGLDVVAPKTWLGFAELLGVSILSALFMVSLVLLLYVIVLNTDVSNATFVDFIPMFLTYVFYFLYLYMELPHWLIVLSPFTAIMGLITATYINTGVPVTLMSETITLNPIYALSSLTAWIVALSLLSVILILRIKYVPPEKLRVA